VIAAGALASVKHLKQSQAGRERHQERVALLKQLFRDRGLPVMGSVSQIVPVMVGNPVQCELISDLLLERHGIYVQPITYPLVPRRTKRLRFTLTSLHSDEMLDRLAERLWILLDDLQAGTSRDIA